MARITVEDCIDKFESRFELVLVASNRARKLHSGENPTVEKDNDKHTVIALREIANETIPIEVLKEKLVEEFQTVSPLDEEEQSLELSSVENQTNDSVDLKEIQDDELDDENILVEDVITDEIEKQEDIGQVDINEDNNS